MLTHLFTIKLIQIFWILVDSTDFLFPILTKKTCFCCCFFLQVFCQICTIHRLELFCGKWFVFLPSVNNLYRCGLTQNHSLLTIFLNKKSAVFVKEVLLSAPVAASLLVVVPQLCHRHDVTAHVHGTLPSSCHLFP